MTSFVHSLPTVRQPRVLTKAFSPVGLWTFDNNLGDQGSAKEAFNVDAGTLQYTLSHEPGKQAAYFTADTVRLLGASNPAPVGLRVTGDVTVQVVVRFDTTIGIDTFGTGIFGCLTGGSDSAIEANNDLYSLQLDNISGFMVPEFTWENGAAVREVVADTDFYLGLDRWYHIVGVREGTTAKLIVNNTLVASASGLTGASGGDNARMRMGLDTNGAGLGFLGATVSSAKVVARALTDSEVKTEWESVLGIAPPPPINRSPEQIANATFSGDASNVSTSGSSITDLINQVGGTDLTMLGPVSFEPTLVTVNDKPAFHCGSGASLDHLIGNSGAIAQLSEFIQDNQWHVFTVVRFDAITALESEDPGHQHLLFGGFNTTSIGGHFALTLHDDGGTDYAQGFANNGSSDITVRTAYPVADSAYHLVEFWNDSTTMGIRLDDGAEVTAGWSGNIPAGSPGLANEVRAGSVNFEGGWDATSNVMAELHVFNAALSATERNEIRAHLRDKGYGFSI